MFSFVAKIILLSMVVLSPSQAPTTLYNPVNQRLIGTPIDQSIASNPQKIIDNLKTVPKGTKVLSYYTKKDSGFLNLSHDFTDTIVPGEENTVLMVYSIVDTFCSNENINTLYITTEGRTQYIIIKDQPFPIIFNGLKNGEFDSYKKIIHRLHLTK